MAGFNYGEKPEVIKQWLKQQGYDLKELFWSDGVPRGAQVVGTTIEVGYPTFRLDERNGEYYTQLPAQVTLINNRFRSDYDPEVTARSMKLFRRLYRRYRSMYRRTPKTT